MNDPEAIQRKLTEPACRAAFGAGRLDLKLDLLTKRTLAYVTTILQILHNQGVVGFREMLHYLNQNEKDFSKTPTPEYREFIRMMKPLWPARRQAGTTIPSACLPKLLPVSLARQTGRRRQGEMGLPPIELPLGLKDYERRLALSLLGDLHERYPSELGVETEDLTLPPGSCILTCKNNKKGGIF